MTSPSVYLHILTYSVKAEEMKHFTESAVKTSDPCGPPAHFDSQHNKLAPYLFMSVDTVEPPTIT